MSVDIPPFPAGLHLLSGWQAGERDASHQLAEVFRSGIEGAHDETFRTPAPSDAVHVSGSIYSDRFSPGTDPGDMLVDADNWQDLPPLDLSSEIPTLLDETLACYRQVTGSEPVLHLSAPYSLAADIFGQELLINALTHEPEFVDRFLDRLADDRVDPAHYVAYSLEQGVPLFMGIGATEIDRHTISDLAMERAEIAQLAAGYVEAIKTVARSIAGGGYQSRVPPWPGTVYFEDVSAESSFELIEAVVGTTLEEGAL